MPAVISRYPTQDLHGKEGWVEDAGKGTLDWRASTAGASARGKIVSDRPGRAPSPLRGGVLPSWWAHRCWSSPTP
jgi:hypothetical protein